MKESIFSKLFHYRETSKISPGENYLTEMLSWLIENIPEFGDDYVKLLLSNETVFCGDVTAETQVSVKKGFIDMVVMSSEGFGFICEHKVNSELRNNQIQDYIDCKDEINPNINFKTVLLTRTKKQHTQKADISLTWNEVYLYYVKRIINYDLYGKLIVEQFLTYLTETGMGEKEGLRTDVVNNYCFAMNLENQIHVLFSDMVNENWKDDCRYLEEFNKGILTIEAHRIRWGRVGIEFNSQWQNESIESVPNIFVGVVLKNDDHKLQFFDNVPQLVVIVECSKKSKHREKLQEVFESFSGVDGYKIEKNPKNSWRTLILERPLSEVITGDDYNQQKEILYSELVETVNRVLNHWVKSLEQY